MTESAARSENPAAVKRACVLLGITLTFSCFYFFSGGGWNQSAHFDLIRALVEQGTIRIDAYHENTGDKSFYNEHYFSNKAPGAPFLAAPFVGAARLLLMLFRVDPEGDSGLLFQARIAILACATLPLVAAALAMVYVALQWGASLRAAAISALVFGLGTPAWAYGASLWAHALCAGCLAVAFAAVVALRIPGSVRRDQLLAFSVGLASGWAVLTDYPAIGAAVLLAALALWSARADGRTRIIRVAIGIVVGTLLPIFLLGLYNTSAFGSPFRLSYGSVVGFQGHREGAFGVTYPKPGVMVDLLFSPGRGLLRISPGLWMAIFGLAWAARRPDRRLFVAGAVAIFAYLFLFNASYFYWWGGNCYGPRFMTAALPFLCLGLAPAWDALKTPGRIILATLSAAGVFWTLVAISTHPMPPDSLDSAFDQLLWPSFAKGALSLNQDTFFSTTATPAFNLGESLGLRGLWSLAPLAAGWAVLACTWVWAERALPSGVFSPPRSPGSDPAA